MNLAVQQRIIFLMTALKGVKDSILSGVMGQRAIPKFFEGIDDEALDSRMIEIMDSVESAEEWEPDQMLELASIFLMMYLKEEYLDRIGA